MRLSVGSSPSPDWNSFVRSRIEASIYLLSGWTELAGEVFGHEVFFLEARDDTGALAGVLPLVRQRSLVFGDFMTSVPFFNYGGAVGSEEAIALLMDRARDLAQQRGCAYLEFRDVEPRPGEWRVRKDKVSMILDLPADAASLSKQLGAKLRSQVKRADRESPVVRKGGRELVPDFYEVFCRTMRDLGTPVYPRRFFEAVVEKFPDKCLLVVIDWKGRPAAAAFLVIASDVAEIPWAACRNDAKPAGFNMKLYWEVLMTVVERGCKRFDFGRSTVESGTYRFKKQWGAQPLQLHWHRWERHPKHEGAGKPASESKAMLYATAVWQRLPLSIANTLGQWVSPSLPW